MRAGRLAELKLTELWGTKVSLFRVFADPEALGVTDLMVLLWASLVHEEPELELDYIERWVPWSQVATVTEAVLKAWEIASSDPNQGEGDRQEASDPLARNQTPASPGATSGAGDGLTSG